MVTMALKHTDHIEILPVIYFYAERKEVVMVTLHMIHVVLAAFGQPVSGPWQTLRTTW